MWLGIKGMVKVLGIPSPRQLASSDVIYKITIGTGIELVMASQENFSHTSYKCFDLMGLRYQATNHRNLTRQ